MIRNFTKKLKNNHDLFELLKGSGLTLILKISGMALGYFSMLYITNFYGASEFGLLSLGISVISLLAILPRFGFDNSLVRIIGEYKIKYKSHIGSIILNSLLFSIVIGLITFLVSYFNSSFIANNVLNNPEFEYSFRIASIFVIPYAILAIAFAFFQAYKKPVLYILFQTSLIQLLFLLLVMGNDILGFNLNIVLVYGLAIALTTIVAFLLLVTKFGRIVNGSKNKIRADFSIMMKIVKKSSPMLMASSFTLILTWADTIMLSIFKTNADIGIYNVAYRLSTLIAISLIAVNAIAAPKFVEYYVTKNMRDLRNTVKNSTKMIFILAFPVFLVFTLFPSFILSFFGAEFSEARYVLIVLCFGQLINAISGSVGYLMQMTDNEVVFQKAIIYAAILNILLNLIFIPSYGVLGASFASLISMAFWNLSLVIFIKRKFGFWTIFGL